MRAREMTAAEVVARSRRYLGVSTGDEGSIDVTVVGALLRRAAGIYCPCSRATLREAAVDSLHLCGLDDERLRDIVDDAVDGLLSVGDLLELQDVTVGDLPAAGTWVFGAPPAYIERPSGTLFLVGVVADQESILPPRLNERVTFNGVVREISPLPGEDLSSALQQLGLIKLSESSWLKCPRPIDARVMIERLRDAVQQQPLDPPIAGLQIIDPARPVNYYRGRWTTASSHSGLFVGRRPQLYGAPIWCCVELKSDGTTKVMDLPLRKSRWRGCDAAWHIQMAIDACRQTPQFYRRESSADWVCMTFFGPLPQWAERRLMIVGRYLDSSQGLFTYELPKAESASEEAFLENHLYLKAVSS